MLNVEKILYSSCVLTYAYCKVFVILLTLYIFCSTIWLRSDVQKILSPCSVEPSYKDCVSNNLLSRRYVLFLCGEKAKFLLWYLLTASYLKFPNHHLPVMFSAFSSLAEFRYFIDPFQPLIGFLVILFMWLGLKNLVLSTCNI